MSNSGADIDHSPGVPLYLRIAQQIRQDIYGGIFRPGHMLPIETELQERFGVSRDTIRGALQLLREEGLVETRRGAGTRVRHAPAPIMVTAGPEDEVSTRMPTRAEREALGVAEAVPVLVLKKPGRREELFDGNRAKIRYQDN